MSTWIMKSAGGPDPVGGFWPVSVSPITCRNRSGGTHSKGDVVMLALTPGVATEIATNDRNSYIPGASNDTIWNTVVDPTANTNQGSGLLRGCIVGVCVDSTPIVDNAYGQYQFFGIVDEAFCIKAGTDNMAPGDPLTITTAKNFDGVINSNEVVVAMYTDPQTNLTNRRLRRVFLHNGAIALSRGQAGPTAFT